LLSVAETLEVLTGLAPVAGMTLLLVTGLGFLLLRHTSHAERQIRDIAETMPGGLYRVRIDARGSARILWASHRAADILGVDAAALVADIRSFGLHPEDDTACRAALLEAGRENRDLTLEARRILPGGGIRHWRATGRPRPDGDGWLFDGVIFDITEERRIADAVHASERRLAMVLDAAQEAIVAL